MIAIRNAELKDIKAIADIHSYCWREAYPFMPQNVQEARNREFRTNQWRDRFRALTDAECLFALVGDGDVCGFTYACPCTDPAAPIGSGELHATYVLPKYRGGASGPLLMTAAGAHMIENGLNPLVLWCFKQNRMSLVYRQIGWAPFIYRDRVISGSSVPEIGLAHNDFEGLKARLLKRASRFDFSVSALPDRIRSHFR